MNASRPRRAALYVRVSTDTPLAKGKRSAEETGCEHEARHTARTSQWRQVVHNRYRDRSMSKSRARQWTGGEQR